jgi:hypothetical protein
MATTAASKKASFATPDRDVEVTGEAAPTPAVKTVTPPTPTAGSKQVRFDNKDEPSSSSNIATKRGLVSRRGGRYGSPSRNSISTTAVLEYKTYRSPKRNSVAAAAESSSSVDNGVPSLCSSNTGSNLREEAAPSQISCDKAETTSPLHEETAGASSKKKAQVTFSPRPNTESGMERVC